MAASLGFEPRQSDSESLVLPLHYEAKIAGRGNYGDAGGCKAEMADARLFPGPPPAPLPIGSMENAVSTGSGLRVVDLRGESMTEPE
jgi:hypothetical protein